MKVIFVRLCDFLCLLAVIRGFGSSWKEIQLILRLEHTLMLVFSVFLFVDEIFCWIILIMLLFSFHISINSTYLSVHMSFMILNVVEVFLGISGKIHFF